MSKDGTICILKVNYEFQVVDFTHNGHVAFWIGAIAYAFSFCLSDQTSTVTCPKQEVQKLRWLNNSPFISITTSFAEESVMLILHHNSFTKLLND